jgi:hypothetical protein
MRWERTHPGALWKTGRLLVLAAPLVGFLHFGSPAPVPVHETAPHEAAGPRPESTVAEPPPPPPVRFYVAVGPLGDSSGAGREGLDELARRLLVDELGRLPGVEAHGEVPAPDEFRVELHRRHLEGLVLQGSVTELERRRQTISAAISVLVLDEEQTLRALLRGNGDATRTAGELTEAEIPAAQADALRAAVRAAVDGLDDYLQER